MRIGLLTEGARPYATGESWLWRGRLVRGLTQRESAFTVPSHPAHRESRGRATLPRRVNRMRTVPQRDRRGGGRHEVSGRAAALPGPLAKRFFGAPLTAEDRPGAAARTRSAVAQGLAACRGVPREPMAHAPAHRKAYATDAYGTPPPSAGPAATDSGGAPGPAPVAVLGSTPAPALVAVLGSGAAPAPMAFSVSELAPALTAPGSALVVVPGSTPAPAAPAPALVAAPGSTLAPAPAAPAPVPATGLVGAEVVPAGTPLPLGTVPQSASAPAQGPTPAPAAPGSAPVAVLGSTPAPVAPGSALVVAPGSAAAPAALGSSLVVAPGPEAAPAAPGSVPAPAAPGSALVPAPAPVALSGSEPAPVPRRRRTARPDHGDRSMTRPDDPAIPAAPDRPATAPERPAGIAPRATARRSPATARRGPAGPVTALPPYHRDPRERAVDPSGADPDTVARAAWTLLALLPGAACLATAGALRITEGVLGDGARALVTVVGALLACLALRACLAHGPLRAPGGTGRAGLYACWLLSYAVYGEGLLDQVMTGGPDGWWGGDPAPLLGLAVAVAPAAGCAHVFTLRAHRERAGSRTPEEFGAGVRPLLLAAALFLGALLPLLHLADRALGGGGTGFAAVALGLLFFLARLLAAHGLPEPGAVALAAACAVEAAAPALALSGRLPGLEPVAQPVNALVSVGGTGAVGALACGAAALGLLLYAPSALSRALAHTHSRT
ncbi:MULTISPECIES: hypothetical protein [unclassified Streptomyces]|uniref:hypothetical protein n=1 Tax=unclassified Streptomyces TaxID=2593676 RepID=UPI000AA004CE|nr:MULTISPECIES: hypothetical protein [unclassified Streptomyces]